MLFFLVPGRSICSKEENSRFLSAHWVWCTTMLVVLCSAIHMSIFLPTSINNETKAPFRVPNSTSPQQHLLIVQGILLSSKSKSSCEFIQFVIRCLTFDFTYRRKVKTKMEILAQKDVSQYCIFSTSPDREYSTL